MARNPATGEQVKVPAKRVFKFLPAKALKEAVMAKRGGRAPARKTAQKRHERPRRARLPYARPSHARGDNDLFFPTFLGEPCDAFSFH